jgi:hypothetical protein
MILESLDDKKTRIVTTPHHKVSVLQDISIYTTDYDKSIPLRDIFKKIYEEFNDDPGVDSKSDGSELRSFMEFIAPDHDPDRVYTSDIKKIVSWYIILNREAPELIKDLQQDTGKTDDGQHQEEDDDKSGKENKEGE